MYNKLLWGIVINIVFLTTFFFSIELHSQPPGHGGIPPGQGGGNPGNGGGPGGPGNPCPPPFRPCEPIPINGGVEYVIAAGVILGIRKLYKSKNKRNN